MKHYKILALSFLIVFAGGFFINSAHKSVRPSALDETAYCRKLFPQAQTISAKFSNPPHYKIYSTDPASGKEILSGLAFRTNELTPAVKGYSGPVDLMVGITPQGTISGIELISHKETSTYVQDLGKFLKQFISFDTHNVFQLGQDVDGITQATITSTAVARSLKEGLGIITRDVLAVQAPAEKVPAKSFPFDQLILIPLLFIIAGLGFVLRKAVLRKAALLGGLLYLGFKTAGMFSVVNVANAGLGKIPPPLLELPLWHLLLILTIVSSLLIGMLYCGSICPFAAVQEILFWLGRKLRLSIIPVPERIDRKARYLKHVLLITVLGLSLLAANANIANVEVYVTFFTRKGTALAWIFLLLMLFAAPVNYRFWCKYFCPSGAFNGLLSRFSLFKIRIGNPCNLCGHCQSVCPTQAIQPDDTGRLKIDYPECVLCNACVKHCPKSTIKWRTSRDAEK